jgi:hypothetical protein
VIYYMLRAREDKQAAALQTQPQETA